MLPCEGGAGPVAIARRAHAAAFAPGAGRGSSLASSISRNASRTMLVAVRPSASALVALGLVAAEPMTRRVSGSGVRVRSGSGCGSRRRCPWSTRSATSGRACLPRGDSQGCYCIQPIDAVDDGVAASWALDLWRSLPTPHAGQRVRQVTVTRVSMQHRIRWIDAATLRAKLRLPAVKGCESLRSWSWTERVDSAPSKAAHSPSKGRAGRRRSWRGARAARRRAPRPGQPPTG